MERPPLTLVLTSVIAARMDGAARPDLLATLGEDRRSRPDGLAPVTRLHGAQVLPLQRAPHRAEASSGEDVDPEPAA